MVVNAYFQAFGSAVVCDINNQKSVFNGNAVYLNI
jgi:hypothetical protein